MNVLFLSSWFPYPPDNGSKIRIFNLLKALAYQKNEVTLISFYKPGEPTPEFSCLEAVCQQIIQVPGKSFNPHSVQSILGFFTPIPRSIFDTFSIEAARYIQNTVHDNQFDLVIASQIGMAGYRNYFQHIPAIFEEVELGVPYQQLIKAGSTRTRMRAGLSWNKHRRYIEKLLTKYQACTVVSSQEKQLVKKIKPEMENVTVIPNCINIQDYDGFKQSPFINTLIYTGSFRYQANYEAMVWFLSEVFPLIREQIPEVELTITGDNCDLPLPTNENVILTGYLNDIRPYIAKSWISLAPLQTGGGTRLKILEAMAIRTPVVATSKGAEGLEVHAGRDLLIADTPEDFARCVIRLLREPDTHKELSENAYKIVSKEYNWVRVMPKFLDLVESVAIG